MKLTQLRWNMVFYYQNETQVQFKISCQSILYLLLIFKHKRLFNCPKFNFSLLSPEGKLVLQQEHTKDKVHNNKTGNMNKTQLKV